MASATASRGDKALSIFLDSLKLLREISEAAPVPILKGAIGTALHISDTIVVSVLIQPIPLISPQKLICGHDTRKRNIIKTRVMNSAIK
jgi:hypothetical protein